MQIPRRKSEELRRRVEGPLHLTEVALNGLKEKLAHLKRVMPGYAQETQQAAALGDRSDNAQYREAKSRLTRTHFQIFTLQDQIKRAVVIKQGKNISGKVQLGSTVTLEIDGARKIFQILGAHETNPTLGKISFQSPLGSALMNHKKSDAVEIKTPKGIQKYTIIEIK